MDKTTLSMFNQCEVTKPDSCRNQWERSHFCHVTWSRGFKWASVLDFVSALSFVIVYNLHIFCVMSKKDSANMSYFGSLKSIVDYEALDVQDLSRSVALIVAFVVLLWKGNQRLWALADVFGLGLCGLACFFFPQAYIQYQVKIEPT